VSAAAHLDEIGLGSDSEAVTGDDTGGQLELPLNSRAEEDAGSRGDAATVKDSLTVELEARRQYAAVVAQWTNPDGTKKPGWLKMPNGTSLNERQWVQVHTPNFKRYFGDWEKNANIGKLRNSAPLTATGEEWRGKYELNPNAAQKYITGNLRTIYTVSDNGDQIQVNRTSAGEVLSHNRYDQIHLKSIALIPDLIRNGIFVEELPNEKWKKGFERYRYYVTGLKMGGVDYTVKMVVGVGKNGEMYYDHELTQIEKGDLIDSLNRLSSAESANQTSLPETKDRRLSDLLKKNLNVSKVVDANGWPLVVYHGTDNENLTVFDLMQARKNADIPSFFFTTNREEAEGYGRNVISAFLNIRNPVEKPNANMRGSDVRKQLEQNGYDGTIVVDDYSTEYAAFNSIQIKSATGNSGVFSLENASTLGSRADEAQEEAQARATATIFTGGDGDLFSVPGAPRASDIPDDKDPINSMLKRAEAAGVALSKAEAARMVAQLRVCNSILNELERDLPSKAEVEGIIARWEEQSLKDGGRPELAASPCWAYFLMVLARTSFTKSGIVMPAFFASFFKISYF
jgi:hypothetical protein